MQPGKIDLRTLPSVKCKCGSIYFDNVVELKLIPKLLSPTGDAIMQPVPGFICCSCAEPLNLELEAQKKVLSQADMIKPA